MNETLLNNLVARFKAIEDSKDLTYEHYIRAVMDYADYIGRSEGVSAIVRKMALEGDANKDALQEIFNTSAITSGFRNQNQKKDDSRIPLFWDKDVEEKIGLLASFRELLQLEGKRLKEAKKQNVGIEDLLLPEDRGQIVTTKREEIFAIRMFHNNLVERLSVSETKKLSFDEQRSALLIGNDEVRFRKFTEQYHTLRILFADKGKLNDDWFFSDIAEQIDASRGYSDKQIHNYFSAIKRRVASETGIKDLFLTTNQSARINPDYL